MPISRPTTTPRPTAIDVTAPTITRERMSRPYWSVPKGWAADGPCSRPPIDIASGSAGVQTRLSVAGGPPGPGVAPPPQEGGRGARPLILTGGGGGEEGRGDGRGNDSHQPGGPQKGPP